MNIFGYILIVLTLVITIVIGVKQPPMHSRVMIYDSQYEIVDEKKSPPVETVTKTEELPTMTADNNLTQVQIVFQEQEQPKVTQEVKRVETPKTVTKSNQNKVETSQKTTPQIKTTTQKPVVKTEQKQNQKTEQKTTVQPKTQTQQVTQTQTHTPQTQTVKQTQAPKANTVTVLTQQQEEIAWNVWRSNLQNQLMKDTRMPNIPIGTVFKVSFDVDRNGRVSNVQTWSTDSKYTPYAIEFIAPVIKSYQGKSILDFPQGSQRTKTTFTGGWKISQTARYSTPANYNDIEKVTK